MKPPRAPRNFFQGSPRLPYLAQQCFTPTADSVPNRAAASERSRRHVSEKTHRFASAGAVSGVQHLFSSTHTAVIEIELLSFCSLLSNVGFFFSRTPSLARTGPEGGRDGRNPEITPNHTPPRCQCTGQSTHHQAEGKLCLSPATSTDVTKKHILVEKKSTAVSSAAGPRHARIPMNSSRFSVSHRCPSPKT